MSERESSLEAWLASKDPAKHALADEVLREMGEEKSLLFLLTAIKVEERRRQQRGLRNSVLIFFGLFLAQYIIRILMGPGHNFWAGGFANFIVMAALFGGLPSRLHQHCVERLAAINDRRAFPALVATLNTPYVIAFNTVVRRLTRMLPELEAEDFAALPKDHRARLFQFINPKHGRYSRIDEPIQREFARALLLAVTRIGNGDALPIAKKVASAKPKTSEDDLIRRTAQNCLPLLEKARAEQKKTAEPRMVLRR